MRVIPHYQRRPSYSRPGLLFTRGLERVPKRGAVFQAAEKFWFAPG